MWDPAKCQGPSICVQQHTVLTIFSGFQPRVTLFTPIADSFFVLFWEDEVCLSPLFAFTFFGHLSLYPD